MKRHYVEKNPNTDKNEATITLTDEEIILLKDILGLYDQGRLGDIDDPKKMGLKKHLMKEMHEAFKEVRPS